MHCIRLLRSGLEILQRGGVTVDRNLAGDIDDLKAILRGDYAYEELMKMAEDIEATALQILFASGGFTIPTRGTRRLKMAGVYLLKLWKNLMMKDY